MRITEEDIQEKAANALDSDGYVTEREFEIGNYICDIFIKEYKYAEFNSQDLPVALEIKTANTDIRKAIGQCLAYEVNSKQTVNAQLCLPNEGVGIYEKQMCKRAGIGLVQIHGVETNEPGFIKPVYDPEREIFLR